MPGTDASVTCECRPLTRKDKSESRLSILALLAPDSPRSSPPNDYPGYRLPTSSSPADSRMEHTLSSSLQQDPAGSKAGRLQALLPRPSEQQQPARAVPAQTTRQPGVAVPRRIATIVACENCRAKRTKVRPYLMPISVAPPLTIFNSATVPVRSVVVVRDWDRHVNTMPARTRPGLLRGRGNTTR